MMYGSLDEKTLPKPSPHSSPAQATTWARVAKTAILLAAVGLLTVFHQLPRKAEATISVEWSPCGAGLECASVTVPLDWSAGFTRNVSIALARLPASDKANKIGSLFMNPGGPGASGTAFVHQIGSTLSTLVQGRYDIVGFDPRGVNLSTPRVSCFPNALSEVMFVEHETLYFNTPVNWTHENESTKHGQPELVAADVYRQAQINAASDAGLKARCLERSGDVVAFMGTANVVRDIDYISQLLDGPGSRVNFWGFSYGTVLGQYLTTMLPPGRLGRVAIDGVISASLWYSETDWISKSGEDVDAVVEGFATTCIAAGPERCALASLGTSSAILAAIDALIDRLYYSPSAVHDMSLSGFVGKSVHVQLALFTSTYSIALWPTLAQVLAKAIFDSNEAPILSFIMAGALYPAKLIEEPDSLMGLYQAVLCADSPFNFTLPPPTADNLASAVVSSESDVSRRLGSFYVRSGGCHHWPVPSQSFFGGNFKLAKNTLDTPVLLLSQRYDPVTPIRGAKSALKNFGSSNARLVEQRGYGHAAISQGSLCTTLILRKFFVDGVAPLEAHSVLSTSCPPYAPFLGFAGVAAAMVFSTVGAAYGTSKAGIGISGMGTLRPDLIMKSLIPVVMAGIIAVYGLVVSVLIIGGLSPDEPYSLFAGFIHLAAGLSCGLTGLAAGHAIGIVGDACARAYMFQSKIFVAMVLMLIFAEVIGLYGLIVALILNTRAGEGVCY